MKSLRSALRVLAEFEAQQRDFGVVELAARSGLAKSRVSKVLDAFAEAGLIAQDAATRRYSVGLRSHTLATRYLGNNPLCRAAVPVMRELLNRTGHSVRLSVLDGERVLYLAGLEGPLFMDTGWRSGNAVPARVSSAGRVLLAFAEPGRFERILAQPVLPPTRHSVTDEARVRALIESARVHGYSLQRDETSEGLGVLSVPLFGATREALGALGIAFPSHLELPDEPALIAALHEAARAVSQRLGCAVYPFGGTAPLQTHR